jgi:undecaprenyl-diphosphatase
MSNIIVGIILGIVQGISEWLPISSKTQVLVASTYLLHLNFQQAYSFGLFMEVGTILAAIIYFRREMVSLIRAITMRGSHEENRLLIYVVVATVITAIIATPLYLYADSITEVPIGIPMLIIGAVLIIDAIVIRYSRKRKSHATNTRKLKDLKIRDYAIVGIAQGIAALPGVSRSGMTTSFMLLMKIEPDEAFRLSFIVGIFASAGAFALTMLASHANLSSALSSVGTIGLVVAIATATIISLLLIDFLLKVAGRSEIVYLTAALGILAIIGGVMAMVFATGIVGMT